MITGEEESVSVLEREDECPAIDTCPPKLIFHETDCTKYYECKNGQKNVQYCQAGLHFSKIWSGCVKPSVSECIPDDNDDVECKNHGDLVPHECNCHKFYECRKVSSEFWKILHNCYDEEHFSKRLRQCVAGNTCEDEDFVYADCQENRRSPHECQCEKYYVCRNNRQIVKDCPEGSHFSNSTLDCELGSCPDKTRECDENTQRKHECDCEKYYTCLGGEWALSHCENGNHFSNTSKRCEPKEVAGCVRLRPGECDVDSDTRWAHECDCRLYYRCQKNQKEIYGCSWGDYFDRNKRICVDAKKVKYTCRNDWDDWLNDY